MCLKELLQSYIHYYYIVTLFIYYIIYITNFFTLFIYIVILPFTPLLCKGVNGVSEHTEMLSHILKTAKREQRCITIALLDLKNAFGEMHHNLIVIILASLQFHHVPAELIQLFKSSYENNYVVVSIKKLQIPSEWSAGYYRATQAPHCSLICA